MTQQFTRVGGAFFRKGDSGELFAVTDRDTLNGLKAGQLPFNSVENTRGLSFSNSPTSSPIGSPSAANQSPISGQNSTSEQNKPSNNSDIGSLLKEQLVSALTNYKGVTNIAELEERRQSLLRQQLLSAPFSSEGEKNLTGSQKLSLLRDRGKEFEPQLKSLEREIIEKKNLPIQQIQTLTAMSNLAESLGLLDDKKLEELKLSHPEISSADTMEEALGFLGSEIKKDKNLERQLKIAQINASVAATEARSSPKGTQLPSGQVVNLSDAKFLPGVLDELEQTINSNKGLIGFRNAKIFGVGVANLSDDKLKIQDDLQRAAQLVGKFMEGGVLRKEDEIKYANMLPKLSDKNASVSLDKLKGVREMLGLKYNNYLIDFAGNGYDVSSYELLDFGSESSSQERIKVEVISSGQTGTIPANEFDPDLYKKI